MELPSLNTHNSITASRSRGASAQAAAATSFLFVFGLVLLPGRTDLLCDPGIFWHVVVGEQILSTGQLIHRDPFSFTFAGRPWIAQQWLAECLMAAIHSCAGFTGLVLISTAVVAAVFSFVAGRLRRNGLHILPSLILVLLAVAAVAGHVHARPHLSTMAFLAISMASLANYERCPSTLWALWRLVPLYIIWTNLHGGMLGGVVTFGLAVAGWTTFWLCGLSSPIRSWRQTAGLAAILVALAAASFVNPYGLRLPETWFALISADLTFIAEHAPLNVRTPIGGLTVAVAIVYVAVLLRVKLQAMRVTWLLPLAWFVLGLGHVRHAPLFSVAAIIAIADALPASGWAPLLRKRSWLDTDDLVPAGSRRWMHWAAVIWMGLFFAAAAWRWNSESELWAKPCPEVWAEDILLQLRQFAQEHPEGTRIFNEMQYGGFLIYHAPRLRIFVDDRCELYGEAFLRECLGGYQSPARLERWVDQYGIEAALVSRGSPFDRAFSESPDWRLIAQGSASLYHRR